MSLIENLEGYRPDFYVSSLFSGQWWEMLEGIEAVFTDLDCVLADPKTDVHNPAAIAFLREARDRGICSFVIITNTLGKKKRKDRADVIRNRIGGEISYPMRLEALDMKDKKPSPIGFERAMKGMLLDDPGKILMIGDQLATDIRGGNRVGMRTCLVDPFGTQQLITRVFNGRKNKRIHHQLGLQHSW